MTAPFVVHCHIPKTGGSALNRRLLFPRFGEQRVHQLYRYVFERASRLPSRHVGRAMRCFAAAGHVPYGYVSGLYPDALYLSVFREPVARTLSFLNFVLARDDHAVRARLPREVVRRAGHDPDAFVLAVLADPRLRIVQANAQTRLASGAPRLGDRPVERLHLEQALRNVARPDYLAGVQEDLDGFVDRLDALLPRVEEPCAVPTSAALEKRLPRRLAAPMLAPRTLEALAAFNALDLRLYDAVLEQGARPLAAAA